MEKQNKGNTKERILLIAAKLFSENGYDRVTTRQIAKEVGINAATIYHHFPSKEDILKSLYNFYSSHLKGESPNPEQLLKLAESESPHEVLLKSEFHFDEDIREVLDQVIVTATRMLYADPESETFIRENIFDPTAYIVKPLLETLVELGRIPPFDINIFVQILSYFCFSAAALNKSSFGLTVEEYQEAMSFLFSMVTTN